MPKKIDLTGKIFGQLTVIEEIPQRKNNKIYWKCQCSCGNIIEVSGDCLRRMITTHCPNCNKSHNKLNLLGQKFGKLTVIEEMPSKNGYSMWKCKCECGNIVIIRGSHLTSENTKSCGCTSTNKLIEYNHTRMKDLTNQKFGELIALYPNGSNDRRRIIWHCKCSCGKECNLSSDDLISGNTKSCGCKRNSSFGEEKIKNFLEQNKIDYIKEYTPKTLSFKGRFDFYIPSMNVIIEYDGIQHYEKGTGNYDNDEKFIITQEHDQIKNQWCKDNDIILIRIPYTKYDTLCIEDLLPGTSSFKI